ncbi:DNA polymerase III subunit delta' [Cereibacter changlensis JA139]|uniref:DNA polymerase III subunit delta n=2 Tax=Cereibacter changlensis TaxID=402884 RepID=A0A2T4JSK4_9RHOB|nr:DNA polymerase III subunit delta' [Cereibacter changlensis]PTE20885.1 DNA polymerase III subunit delta' [Cereibacter changlensis JA139]PZX53605.1 DNA polymerase III delta prime subunit [Cereibacter changlensis]
MAQTALEDIPEPDRVEGAPHPRDTLQLIGQDAAEAEFLASFSSGRLHHGWLVTGPLGVGKATFAWKLARFLLATPEDGGMFAAPPPETLDIAADHPVARRIASQAEGRLFLLRRAWDEDKKKLKTVISVDDVRRMKSFFSLSSADGGRRVAIVDPADEMNPSAANALLKLLEEPPAGVTLILISHQPFRLLPTIRSRCRELRLGPLGPADMAQAMAAAGAVVEAPEALAELAGGSVGEAIRLTNLDGMRLYQSMIALFATLPRLDRPRALALAEAGAGRGNEPKFELILTLLDLFLARLARAGTMGYCPPEACPGEAALIARLSPSPWAARTWAELAQTLGLRARRGRAVNLDPAALLMDMLLRIDETAGLLAPR